jgi:hypothetical protein
MPVLILGGLYVGYPYYKDIFKTKGKGKKWIYGYQ